MLEGQGVVDCEESEQRRRSGREINLERDVIVCLTPSRLSIHLEQSSLETSKAHPLSRIRYSPRAADELLVSACIQAIDQLSTSPWSCVAPSRISAAQDQVHFVCIVNLFLSLLLGFMPCSTGGWEVRGPTPELEGASVSFP